MPWASVDASQYDALLLVGGHAPGMIQYLESPVVTDIVKQFWRTKPVAAGVVVWCPLLLVIPSIPCCAPTCCESCVTILLYAS